MPKPQLYYTSLTNYGLEAVQKASFMSQPLNITHLAVGDSLGSYYEPSGDMSALKGEKYRGEINRIYQDKNNPSLMIFEAIIPHTSGGYTIREAGLFDEDGNLFAIAKLAETVKPESNEGEAKELYIRLIIEISNAANITFNMNSSAVFATHEWSHEHFAPISHISDFDNPHKVTAAQVGAWAKEENKRIAIHTINRGGAHVHNISDGVAGIKNFGIHSSHLIRPRFKKSKFYFLGSAYLQVGVKGSQLPATAMSLLAVRDWSGGNSASNISGICTSVAEVTRDNSEPSYDYGEIGATAANETYESIAYLNNDSKEFWVDIYKLGRFASLEDSDSVYARFVFVKFSYLAIEVEI